MLEEFFPIFYAMIGVGGAVFGLKYYANYRTNLIKAQQKAIKEAASPEAGIDDFCNMLLNAPKLYEEYSKKIAEIKARNPNADLSQENMEVKILEYAAKHPTIIRFAIPIVKPILSRKIKGLSKAF